MRNVQFSMLSNSVPIDSCESSDRWKYSQRDLGWRQRRRSLDIHLTTRLADSCWSGHWHWKLNRRWQESGIRTANRTSPHTSMIQKWCETSMSASDERIGPFNAMSFENELPSDKLPTTIHRHCRRRMSRNYSHKALWRRTDRLFVQPAPRPVMKSMIGSDRKAECDSHSNICGKGDANTSWSINRKIPWKTKREVQDEVTGSNVPGIRIGSGVIWRLFSWTGSEPGPQFLQDKLKAWRCYNELVSFPIDRNKSDGVTLPDDSGARKALTTKSTLIKEEERPRIAILEDVYSNKTIWKWETVSLFEVVRCTHFKNY